MGFEPVTLKADPNDKYWNPQTEGEEIEGNFCAIDQTTDQDRMVLDMGDDKEVILPGHAMLRRYMKSLEIGDYIKVIYKGEKASNTEGFSPTKLYKVLKDDKKAVVYEFEEE